jgi:N-acetyl-anhydromuramoyl-L-alanine amidase
MRLRFDTRAPGWIEGATWISSPNFDARPKRSAAGAAIDIDLLVIHYISLPAGRFGGDAIVRLFTNQLAGDSHPELQSLRDTRVSAHFLIRRRGECLQFVGTDDRAWHAGVSQLFDRHRIGGRWPSCVHRGAVSALERVDQTAGPAPSAALRGRAQ